MLQAPFIPTDKPRFWLLFFLASISGMGFGIIGFGAAWFELRWLELPMMFLFICCWMVAAVSWFGYFLAFSRGVTAISHLDLGQSRCGEAEA